MGPADVLVTAEGAAVALGDTLEDGDCEGGSVVVGLGLLEGPLGSTDTLGPGDDEGILAGEDGANEGWLLFVILLLGEALDDGRDVAVGENEGGALALGTGLADGPLDGGDVNVGPGLVVGTTLGMKD